MPVNLNALIRYKTIDLCLRNTAVLVDVDYLIKQCSEALYDSTGNKSGVSERTIRNDIRILRSDILGFNAPIIVKDGVYRYTDNDYSIFKTSFSEIELLMEIQELLVEEFHNITNKNLPILLERLSSITKKNVLPEFLPKPPTTFDKRIGGFDNYSTDLDKYLRAQNVKKSFWIKPKPIVLKWGFVFRVIIK
ncbi:hypothetical protein [uncultured Nonlabens sp.]|uniref:hypothetical protein n=1 Tax=uncultured Nonlabens sp. TaxID=859306 RepID=UPI002620E524|nr:hypothetical protein [uncultured Nonlabens sp.]